MPSRAVHCPFTRGQLAQGPRALGLFPYNIKQKSRGAGRRPSIRARRAQGQLKMILKQRAQALEHLFRVLETRSSALGQPTLGQYRPLFPRKQMNLPRREGLYQEKRAAFSCIIGHIPRDLMRGYVNRVNFRDFEFQPEGHPIPYDVDIRNTAAVDVLNPRCEGCLG